MDKPEAFDVMLSSEFKMKLIRLCELLQGRPSFRSLHERNRRHRIKNVSGKSSRYDVKELTLSESIAKRISEREYRLSSSQLKKQLNKDTGVNPIECYFIYSEPMGKCFAILNRNMGAFKPRDTDITNRFLECTTLRSRTTGKKGKAKLTPIGEGRNNPFERLLIRYSVEVVDNHKNKLSSFHDLRGVLQQFANVVGAFQVEHHAVISLAED